MPWTTTPSIICRMEMAVSALRMRTGGCGVSVLFPLFRMRRGRTSSPPLAMADAARANCTVVTLTSWPKAIDAQDVVPHRFSGRSRPGDSAGSSIPDLPPNPKRRT